jgi:aminomethyltransferase
MAVFGGYGMPLWYASAKEEHLAVFSGAGLFDTSHMAVVQWTAKALSILPPLHFTGTVLLCRFSQINLARTICLGAFLNSAGEVIDDSIVYHLAGDNYVVVVNAGMGAVIAKHLSAYNSGHEASITDWTDRLGKVDIQGRAAGKILARILKDPDLVLDRLPYFSFKGHFDPKTTGPDPVILKNGASILLSRTGYTGEFGFEIFIDPQHLVALWDMLLEAGAPYGLLACGLAARDSLRAGAMLPLSHQDIGHWKFINHPWPFALPFNADQSAFTKSFVGSEALQSVKASEYTYAFVGQDLRKVSLADGPVVLDAAGNEIGQVLTCATDMGIGRVDDRIISVASPDLPQGFVPKGLSCGFIKVNTKLSSK